MNLDELGAKLGVEIDRELLQLALTHRSYAYEHGNIPNNERLEFLGDSVLGFVVTSHIYETLNLPEGEMTKIKNAVVSARALAVIAGALGIGEYLLLGKGELAPSNAAQVRKIRRILEELGHTIASPAEARAILGLKGRAQTAF
mgnify:CR=1 FL=1